MEDAAEVVALREGDLAAFGRIYDTYADRLHAYATTLLGDRDAASDAVHDAFLLAHDRIDQLRDPALLRPWLYAITRHQAQRVLRTRGRTTGLEAAAEMSAEEVRWDRSLDADDARLLVLAALAGLNDGDRDVIELALRHDFDNAALSRVLGYSSSHTSARVSRAKQQFDLAVTAVLMMRTRGRHCTDLRALVDGESTLTPLLRKRIARHVKNCPSCTGNRRAALAVLPGVALAVPFASAPESLRAAVMSEVGALHPRGHTANAADRLRWDNDGFPQRDVRWRRRSAAAATVAAVLALVLVGTIGTGALAGRERTTSDASGATLVAATTTAAPTLSPTPTARTPQKDPVRPTATPTASRAPSRPSTPSASSGVAEASGNAMAAVPDPTQAPPPARSPRSTVATPRPAPAAPPTITVTWDEDDLFTCRDTFDLRVYATVSGPPITAVTAAWNASTGSNSTPLARSSGSSWSGVLEGIPTSARPSLTVRVTTAAGLTTASTPQRLAITCGE